MADIRLPGWADDGVPGGGGDDDVLTVGDLASMGRRDRDEFADAFAVFRRRLVDPRTALERRRLSPGAWLDDPWVSGDLGTYDLATRTGCWPSTRRMFERAAEPWVNETAVTGAFGTGKTDWAIRLVAYWLHDLSVHADPRALLGLQSHSVITFMLVHMKKAKAEDKLLDPLKAALRRIPYFRDEFPWDMSADARELTFPKGIVVKCGVTDPEAVRSEDLAVLVLDECNFLEVVGRSARDKEGRLFDAAEAIWQAARRRQDSRFKGTSLWTPKIVLMSSRDRPHDFLERREREVLDAPGLEVEGPPDDRVLVDREGRRLYFSKSLWAAKPAGSFSQEMFRVEIGGDGRRSRVLDAADTPTPGARTMDVPEDFRQEFGRNVDEALRELAGVAIAGVGRLFPDDVVLRDAVVEGVGAHPFSRLSTTLVDGGVLLDDRLFHKGVCRCCPGRWRFVHLDVALTQDCLGLGVVHVHGTKQVLRMRKAPDGSDGRYVPSEEPVFKADLLLQVLPPMGGEIRLTFAEELVRTLRDRGMRIAQVTVDAFQCLAAGTLVQSSGGMAPIESLVVGDVVRTLSGQGRVDAVHKYANAPTMKVVLENGLCLEGTPNHKILAARDDALHQAGDVRTFKDWLPDDVRWEWRRLDALSPRDIVATADGPWDAGGDDCVLVPVPEGTWAGGKAWHSSWQPPGRMNVVLAEWLGLMWGDGHFPSDIDKNNGVGLTVVAEDVPDAERAFAALFGCAPPWEPHSDRACGVMRFTSKRILRWMATNGLRKPHVPDVVLKSSAAVRRAFLRGLFATDGSVSARDGGVSLSTVHGDVARTVQLMLLYDAGLHSCITRARRGYLGDFVSKGVQYIVGVRGPRHTFLGRVGFTYASKTRRLAEHAAVKGRRIYSRVLSVTGARADVFDVTVAGDPSYAANGFWSHNSAQMRQNLTADGIPGDKLSVDATAEPYLDLRDAFEERRVLMYDHPQAVAELSALIYYRAQGKVDHPPSIGKDVADGLCGAVAGALQWKAFAMSDSGGRTVGASVLGGGSTSMRRGRYKMA